MFYEQYGSTIDRYHHSGEPGFYTVKGNELKLKSCNATGGFYSDNFSCNTNQISEGFITLSVDNYIYDTVTVTDTLWLTRTDTLWLHDTVTVHDTVYVTGEGIDGAEALNAKVYSSHGQVVVEGADGHAVALYDVNGRLLARKEESGERSVFDVTASGTYMIKIGHYPARKVVVVR